MVSEKPSVAKSIAVVLGAKTRKDGYYEGNGYIVSWCIGHLLGLAQPQDYDEKYKKWRLEDLPIIPQDWKYIPNDRTKKQLKVLSDLMKRTDIETVINACDAGREGELIFRLVYEYCCRKKDGGRLPPIQRLWISSMEESAIASGFSNLKDGKDYDNLYQSALCRGRADWLIGMSGSRLFSILYDAQLRVGRVQTPTLAMIVGRENVIGGFVKEPFYKVEISDGNLSAEREKEKEKQTAENIRATCDGNIAVVTSVQRQEKSAAPPKLYDLTTLQREANRLFGYTATQTLNCVQNLYEQKTISYPRTDSRFLTEDMAAGLPALVSAVAGVLPFAKTIGNITVSLVINNAKVTDHHALIPTPTMPKVDLSALPTAERNILQMISARLICAVSDKHIFAETVVTVQCEGEVFTTKGKTVIQNGWKEVEQAFFVSIGKPKKDEDKTLPELHEGQQFTVKSSVREGFTQPPKHFTEDLLLASMETAGQRDAAPNSGSAGDNFDNDAVKKGLGTPATRASIIENLVKSGFLERKQKQLLPTDKGVNLIKVLPDVVKSPALTADWENKLKQIENGELSAGDFMAEIAEMTNNLVAQNNTPKPEYKALFPSSRPKGEVIGVCPRCGKNVCEAPKGRKPSAGFFCENKDCKFALWRDNKFFTSKKKTLTKEIAIALLTEGRIFMPGLTSKDGKKTYNATILLADKGEGYVGFAMEFENKKGASL